MFTPIIYPTNIENHMITDNWDDAETTDWEAPERRDGRVSCCKCSIVGSPEDMETIGNDFGEVSFICPECLNDMTEL